MAKNKKSHLRKCLPKVLLDLPNRILCHIISSLSILDLRRLSRVNRRLYYFVEDYLIQHRYNTGLLALPNEITLAIVQQMDRQKDRSCLARASLRFYPLIMDYVYRHNVQYGRGGLLIYAAKRNLMGMAQKILHLGGDINTHRETRTNVSHKQMTPLAVAAYYGHERMVRMLLTSGVKLASDGVNIPLLAAIFKRHEKVALILSRELDLDSIPLGKLGSTPLQLACAKKLVNLVRYYLGRKSQQNEHANIQYVKDCSIALYCVLRLDAAKDNLIKRELHEDVYQIALLLLENGADPNFRLKTRYSQSVTPCIIGSRHPDPRVRILFPKGAPSYKPKGPTSSIGRSWMLSPEQEAFGFYESTPETHSRSGQFATLWEFLDGSSVGHSDVVHENRLRYGEGDYEDYTLTSSDIAMLAEGRRQGLRKKLEPTIPPPLSSFPQLGTPKANAQQFAKTFWSKKPIRALSGNRLVQKLDTHSMVGPSQKSKRVAKPTENEPFPQLGQPSPASHNNGRNIWAHFVKDGIPQNSRELKQTFSAKNERNMKDPAQKKTKKKWKPLTI